MSAATLSSAARAQTPFVVCVLVNWNGWRDTLPCLASLFAQEYPALQVLVVDNASTDDSVERIRAAYPSVEVIESPDNAGFGAGCNLGIRPALERGVEFIWLLNNDTIAPPDTLKKLLAAAEGDAAERLGIVGTVLQYQHAPKRIQAWGGGSINLLSGYTTHFFKPAELGDNSFLTFASVLIRSEVLQRIGMLDEGFFMYFEDSDFCFRARGAGWRLAVATETAVLHKVGGATVNRKDARPTPLAHRMFTASGLRFLGRYGKPRPLALVLFVLLRFTKRVLSADLAGMRGVLLGVRDWHRETPRAFQQEGRKA